MASIINFIRMKLFGLAERLSWDGMPDEREICVRYSRGNVNLQLGRIVGVDDYGKMKQCISQYQFR